MEEKNTLRKVVLFAVLALIVVFGLSYKYLGYIKKDASTLKESIDELQVLATQSHDYEQCVLKANRLVSQEPKNQDAWQWKGICENQLGQYDNAKISFEKLLALDPKNEYATAQLKGLENPSALPNRNSNVVSQQDFEKLLNFPIDASILRFIAVDRVNFDEKQSFLSANYKSAQNYKQTVALLQGALKNSGVKFTLEEMRDRTNIIIAAKPPALGYGIFIFSGTEAGVIINLAQ